MSPSYSDVEIRWRTSSENENRVGTATGNRGYLATAIELGYPITYYYLRIRRETSADIAARWQEECARRLPPTVDGRVVCGGSIAPLSHEPY